MFLGNLLTLTLKEVAKSMYKLGKQLKTWHLKAAFYDRHPVVNGTRMEESLLLGKFIEQSNSEDTWSQ